MTCGLLQIKYKATLGICYPFLTTLILFDIDLPTIPAVPSSAGLAPGSATNPPSLRKREAA